MNQPPPFGAPPGGSGGSQDMQRFFKPGIMGGAVGGVISGVPILNFLNCCFCLPTFVGAALAVSIYLKDNPTERLSNADAALCGAVSGAVGGLIAGVLGLFFALVLGTLLTGFYSSLPPQVARNMMVGGLEAAIRIPAYMIGFGSTGALGGFLSMQLFFKDRLAA